jgi:hypothetical protein
MGLFARIANMLPAGSKKSVLFTDALLVKRIRRPLRVQ